MKAALITEKQIEAISNLLDGVIIASPPSLIDHALAIVKSLKLQEPVAYGHWTSPAWSEEPVSLNTSVEKPSGFKTESANWWPLYAGDKHD